MKSIVFILPYFGVWPFWMKYFLSSCAANPTINWLVYSDNESLPLDVPNVQLQVTSLHDYMDNASRVLGVSIPADRPYKLCDLKPMYGLIHEQDITNYDYWGFCDLDVIWGDLRQFLTSDLLELDLISAHRTRISGHCCLLKNSQKMREAFKAYLDWKNICSSNENHRFDESAFSRLFIKYKKLPNKLRNFLSFLNTIDAKCFFIERHSTPNCRTPWIDGSTHYPSEWYWNKGRLTNNASANDFMYFHFLHWKQEYWKSDYNKGDGHLRAGAGLSEVIDADLGSAWKIDKEGFKPLTGT